MLLHLTPSTESPLSHRDLPHASCRVGSESSDVGLGCVARSKDYKRAKQQRTVNSIYQLIHTPGKSEHIGVINNTFQVVLHTAVGTDGPCIRPVF